MLAGRGRIGGRGRAALRQRPAARHVGIDAPLSMGKSLLLGAIILAIVATLLLARWPLTWTGAVCLWLAGMGYALADLPRRMVLAVFLTSMFVVLMMREFMSISLGILPTQNDPIETEHLLLSLFLALLGVLVGAVASGRFGHSVKAPPPLDPLLFPMTRKLFYFLMVFALLSTALRGLYVVQNGYLAFYTSYQQIEAGDSLRFGLRKIEQAMPVVLYIMLGMMPTRREVLRLFVPYGAYLALGLLTGSRAEFAFGVLTCFVYYLARQGVDGAGLEPAKIWQFTPRQRAFGVALGAAVVALFIWLEGARGVGELATAEGEGSALYLFLYGQGVSATVIRNAFTFDYLLPEGQWYLLEFLQTGIPARLLGIPVYYGNTIEHALYGGSMTHALGYAILGPEYLAGRGPGTSFVAEWYHDLGYWGIVAGGVVMGFVCIQTSVLRLGRPYLNGVLLIMVADLIAAPRISATAFLTTAMSPSVLGALAAVFAIQTHLGVQAKRRAAKEAARGPQARRGGKRSSSTELPATPTRKAVAPDHALRRL